MKIPSIYKLIIGELNTKAKQNGELDLTEVRHALGSKFRIPKNLGYKVVSELEEFDLVEIIGKNNKIRLKDKPHGYINVFFVLDMVVSYGF